MLLLWYSWVSGKAVLERSLYTKPSGIFHCIKRVSLHYCFKMCSLGLKQPADYMINRNNLLSIMIIKCFSNSSKKKCLTFTAFVIFKIWGFDSFSALSEKTEHVWVLDWCWEKTRYLNMLLWALDTCNIHLKTKIFWYFLYRQNDELISYKNNRLVNKENN